MICPSKRAHGVETNNKTMMNNPLPGTRPNFPAPAGAAPGQTSLPRQRPLGPAGPRHIIAIDPDVDRSGVAFLHLPSRELHCEAKTFPELIDDLHATKQATDALGESLTVVVEAGWLNRSNWHTHARDSHRKAAAIGRAAGRNHEVGRKIVEMARHMGIETVEQRPLQKCWRGPDGKITAAELAQFTGYTRRTSQDMRDAALLAWVYAGLPIRI